MKCLIKFFVLVLMTFGLLTIYSCDKDDGNNPSPNTRELLMTVSWKFTDFTIDPEMDTDGDGDTESSFFETIPACKKDDIYRFINNYIVEIDNGANKCEPTDSQVFEWTYDLSADEKRMMFNGKEYTIAELNTSTLRLSREDYWTATDQVHTSVLVYNH